MTRIAVVGMACRFADADSPEELWENTLAGRRAFRRIPSVRLSLGDYWSIDPTDPDRFPASYAAVIEGWEFDRAAFRIPAGTYRSTDPTHWLTLETATRALTDAGFPEARGLPTSRTGVLIGNTLTGEFSRASVLRLRWPYVRRTVAHALGAEGWESERLESFLDGLESRFKQPFPSTTADSLAGGLSNTIAGRICNYHDLGGGGYTVDGACASALLAVANACRALSAGELDVVLAGGVDLSIDPFEMIGFARTGALATGSMWVYDERSDGFWPGEGCGVVVLMREADARAGGHPINAVISGVGISSDGHGGITRPEVSGYRTAVERAYQQAGFGIDTVALLEGHGTGTAVGDRTELTALAGARAAGRPIPAAVASVKGMIGHTKAAAGAAGLIRTVMALRERTLPAAVGTEQPLEMLRERAGGLRALREPLPWPHEAPLRAGVTAMGFGGINAHLVVEGADSSAPPRRSRARTGQLARTAQTDELLLIDADTAQDLRARLGDLAGWVTEISFAELADLSTVLMREAGQRPWRAAVVAGDPQQAARELDRLAEQLDAGRSRHGTRSDRAWLGRVGAPARLGLLFPGQGSGSSAGAGALGRILPAVVEAYRDLVPGDPVDTALAQPRIVAGALAGLTALDLAGLRAEVAVGHSLGELCALHWAGALDRETLCRLVAERGRIMADDDLLAGSGAMLGLRTGSGQAAPLLAGTEVVTAGFNGPEQVVVSGPADQIRRVAAWAAERGIPARPLRVSHAFHSPMMEPAAQVLGPVLDKAEFRTPVRPVISTVTGAALAPEADLRDLLREQLTAPVRFEQALRVAAEHADLFVEVGPGRVLTSLADSIGVRSVALDCGSESSRPWLTVLAAAFTAGVAFQPANVALQRATKPLRPGQPFRFLENPCEQAPRLARDLPPPVRTNLPSAGPEQPAAEAGPVAGESPDALELIRRLVAEDTQLPLELVEPDTLLLDDLHLSSITVSELIGRAAQQLRVPAGEALTSVATATIRELADLLREGPRHDGGTGPDGLPVGIRPWAMPYRVAWVDADLLDASRSSASRTDAVRRDHEPGRGETGTQRGGAAGRWSVHGSDPLAVPLARALDRAGHGPGVLLCLAVGCSWDELRDQVPAVVAAVRLLPVGGRFVVLQRDTCGAAALARTVRLELTGIEVTVLTMPDPGGPNDVEAVLEEVARTRGFAEIDRSRENSRLTPMLKRLGPAGRPDPVLGGGDLLLVTGGGKGITAESALALAEDSGACVLLLGRSAAETDAELDAALARFRDRRIPFCYRQADVRRGDQVAAAVRAAQEQFGRSVTAVLHGAGVNRPVALGDLCEADLDAAAAPKRDGLEAVLAAVRPEELRLLVTFGSIIGRAGFHGEAHYALANDWLAARTAEFARSHRSCRTVCVEWSVWSGTGMGERLAVMQALAGQGVAPIPAEEGIRVLRRLVADPQVPPVVVVAGRTEAISTLRREEAELPLWRFLERPVVHHPGAELICEADLGRVGDPYLADHVVSGTMVFPAVLGLEAMAQVAAAVLGSRRAPVEITDLRLDVAVTVPEHGSRRVRIAAVADGPDTVDVVIRSQETDFSVDHFGARLTFADEAERPMPHAVATVTDRWPGYARTDPQTLLPIRPEVDLYGGILFQSGSFRRISGFRQMAAHRADAEISGGKNRWFGMSHPPQLLLGDPGARDALMHANQICVPDGVLLPQRVERIVLGTADRIGRVRSVQVVQDGDRYVYDLVASTRDGTEVESWNGLSLRAMRSGPTGRTWPVLLLGPLLERIVERLLERRVRVEVAVDPDRSDGTGGGWRLEADSPESGAVGLDLRLLDPDEPVGPARVAGARAAAAAAGHSRGGDVPLPEDPTEQTDPILLRCGAVRIASCLLPVGRPAGRALVSIGVDEGGGQDE